MKRRQPAAALLIALAAALGCASSLAAQDPRVQITPRGIRGATAPDLIGNIVAGLPPPVGQMGSWEVIVENRNGTATNREFSVEIYRGGSLVASKVFGGLAGGARASLGTLKCWMSGGYRGLGAPCPWPVGYGCTDGRIVVDVKNAVAESSESNNKYEFCWGTQTTFYPAQ